MKTRAVGTILRLYPLGEHGAIVCWCTPEHGILRTAARSALKPGSDLAGVIDLFHECEFVYTPSTKSDLHRLTTAELITPRLPLRADLARLRLASYMCRLLLCTVEPGAEGPGWHRLLSAALDYTAQSEPRAEILLRFERRLAELHGLYAPGIDPHQALLRHFSHLPSGRDAIV